MYYIQDKDNKILVYDKSKEVVVASIKHIPALKGLEIKSTNRPIVDFQFADTDEYKAKIKQQKEDELNKSSMTALDFVTYIKQYGVTDQDVVDLLDANPSFKLQLTLCQNVYCGVVRQLCPIKLREDLVITDDIVTTIFKDKNKL